MVVNIPIVTLDKIFVNPDEEKIYFLDCTRINGKNDIVSRLGESLDEQIERISKQINCRKVFLVDDVIFSGGVLKNIISKFNKYEIEVIGVASSICTREAYEYFNGILDKGVKANYLLEKDVIDQVCERDFYFGIAGSGIMVDTDSGLCKAPYFKPFGSPYERASIPRCYEDEFSKRCLNRSIYLWEEIEKMANKEILIKSLPEKIVGTNGDDGIVKTLRMELKKL